MRARRGQLDSFHALGIGVAFGLAGCAASGSGSGSGPGGNGQSGTGAQALGGTSGQASGGASAGGAAAAGGPDTGGQLSISGAGASAGGADSSVGGSASEAPPAGGTGGSAGSANGGGGDGLGGSSTGGAMAGSGCTGLLFCDDFESYTVGARPSGKWSAQVRGSANAVIDSTMSYSGTRSVHFTGTVNQSSANLIAQGAPVFPIQGNTLFVRMMMYIKSYPATSGTHSRFMRIGTNTNGLNGTSYALDTYNGTGIEHVNSGMFRDTSLHLSDAAVTGKWVCWEWELDNTAGPPMGDTGTVMAYLWHDTIAVPLVVTHDSLPWAPIPWQMLEVGLEAYQADTQPGDFWIDDVALNSKRIGCSAK